MIALVLMAGRGDRFRAAGYTTPKPLLPLADETPIIFRVLEQFTALDEQPRIITVGLKEHARQMLWALLSATDHLWHYYLWLDKVTPGPMESALAAARLLKVDDELVVAYCDGFIEGGIADALEYWRARGGCDTGALLFESHDARFGYWTGEGVTEKIAVSPHAVAGLFYFRSARAFLERAEHIRGPEVGIPTLLHSGTRTYAIPAQRVIDLGDPRAYEIYTAVERASNITKYMGPRRR